MSGILLLLTIALWLYVAHRITRFAVRGVEGDKRFWIYAIVFAIVFMLPVTDELMARPTFSALCEQGAVLTIDADKIRGRVVRVEIQPSNQLLDVAPIPILHSRISFRDASTGDELGHYNTYFARGGLMARLTNFPESAAPWTGNFSCAPPNRGAYPTAYAFTLLN